MKLVAAAIILTAVFIIQLMLKGMATTYSCYKIETVSVKSGIDILSLGATIKSTANQNLTLDIKANGYTGKRDGVGARISVNYAF